MNIDDLNKLKLFFYAQLIIGFTIGWLSILTILPIFVAQAAYVQELIILSIIPVIINMYFMYKLYLFGLEIQNNSIAYGSLIILVSLPFFLIAGVDPNSSVLIAIAGIAWLINMIGSLILGIGFGKLGHEIKNESYLLGGIMLILIPNIGAPIIGYGFNKIIKEMKQKELNEKTKNAIRKIISEGLKGNLKIYIGTITEEIKMNPIVFHLTVKPELNKYKIAETKGKIIKLNEKIIENLSKLENLTIKI